MFTIQTNHTIPEDKIYWEFQQEYRDSVEHEWIITHGGYHRNPEFNKRAYALFEHKPLKILDIGCGGGNFIEDCINDGHIAAGIDGWPLYTKLRLNAWGKFPNNFISADIGRPFNILYNNESIKFDLITSWECFEHIKTTDIPQLIDNIKSHIVDLGYIIFSTSINPDNTHRTTCIKDWWLELFAKFGFIDTNINFYPHVIRDCPGSSYYCLRYIP